MLKLLLFYDLYVECFVLRINVYLFLFSVFFSSFLVAQNKQAARYYLDFKMQAAAKSQAKIYLQLPKLKLANGYYQHHLFFINGHPYYQSQTISPDKNDHHLVGAYQRFNHDGVLNEKGLLNEEGVEHGLIEYFNGAFY